MKSRQVCLFHRFRRQICPAMAGWLIAAQVLPLARLEARTPIALPLVSPWSSPPVSASAWSTAASNASAALAGASAALTNALPWKALLRTVTSETEEPSVASAVWGTLGVAGAAPAATVNRIVPDVAPPAPFAGFSSSPGDGEFLRGRMFAEPLVPIGRATTMRENRALARALNAYQQGTPEATAPIDTFLRDHADTPWRASLLVNVGSRLRDAGAYTRALATWDEAWALAKDASDPHGVAIADLAVAESLTLSFALKRIDDVEARLAAIATRDVRGSSGNRIAQVREQLAWWRAHPEQFVPAEARALERLASLARKGDRTMNGARAAEPPQRLIVENGKKKANASRRLGWLIGPAERLGLSLRAMRRGAGASHAAGTLVSLKNGHVLALLESQGDRFRAYDAVLNRDLSVSRATLDEEASEYALMSGGATTATGWTEVAAAALPVQFTGCPPGTPDDHEPCPCAGGGPGGPGGSGGPPPSPPGMPTYRLHHSIAGLVIQDTPVTYSVPRGPAPVLSVSYSSRSVEDPAVFTFSNLGQKWRFDWRAYIQERPVKCWSGICQEPEFRVVLRGGGYESYEPPLSSWTTLGPHWRSHAVIVRTSSSPLAYERRMPDGSKEVYSVSEGTFDGARLWLSDVVDPQGQSVHLTYDAQFRLVSLTDAIGQVTTLSYEHASDTLKITKITDPFGRSATFTYNAAGQLASITDAIGLTSSFEYGGDDFIVGMTTPYGTTSFRMEQPIQSGRYLEATDPLGGTERVEYWRYHATLPQTLPAAEVPTGFAAANDNMHNYVSLYWDKRAMMLQPRALASATITKYLLRPGPDYLTGLPNTSVPSSIKRPLESRIWYQYANQYAVNSSMVGMGMQPTVTARVLDDGSSQIWQATYNSLGNMTSRTDPLGRRTSYVYAANGIDLLEVRQTTGSMNDLLATYSNYTAMHLPQTIIDAAGQSTTFTYNSAGQAVTATNAKGETASFVYDTSGRLTSVVRPLTSATTTYTYDGLGRIQTVADSDGYTVTIEYDSLDRRIRLTYPDTTYEQIVYDKLDPVQRRDRAGRWTRVSYDRLRHVVATRDRLGRVTEQQWCTCGSLDSVTDANGNRTRWTLDIAGRVTKESRADGTTQWAYTYEATTSRLKTVTDPKQQVATYTYNPDDNVASIVFTNATIATPAIGYTYDSLYNRAATMVDGTGTTTYAYHPIGVLGATQIASVDGPLTTDTVSYVYDELERLTSRAVNGVGTTHTYDALGRVTTEVNALGSFTYQYVGHTHRPASVLYPNGQSSTYTYFGNLNDHRIQTIHHKRPGGATLSRFDYAYDIAGNVVTLAKQVDANPQTLWTQEYDPENQLLSAMETSTGSPSAILSRLGYGYDRAGNRTREQTGDNVIGASFDATNGVLQTAPGGELRFAGVIDEPGTVSIQGKPADVDQTNAFRGTAPVGSGSSVVTVQAADPSGNVATKNYQVSVAGATTSFSYDANRNMTTDGRRVFEWDARDQLVAVTTGVHRTEYVYDGLRRRVRIIEKQSGVVQSDTHLIWCGPAICEERAADGTTVTRRLFRRGEEVGGVARFIVADHLGSVTEVTDSAVTLLARYTYDVWGQRSTVIQTAGVSIGFSGHRETQDGALWLTFYRAYDAQLGRWLSEDPIGRHPSNLFGYVNNNPLSTVDPDGLDGITINPNVRECLCQLWKDARYGFDSTERAVWIVKRGGELGCERWPWSAQNRQETWKGPPPAGSVAIVHTHPRNTSSDPSEGDAAAARQVRMPVYVCSKDGISKTTGWCNPERTKKGGCPTQVEDRKWYDEWCK